MEHLDDEMAYGSNWVCCFVREMKLKRWSWVEVRSWRLSCNMLNGAAKAAHDLSYIWTFEIRRLWTNKTWISGMIVKLNRRMCDPNSYTDIPLQGTIIRTQYHTQVRTFQTPTFHATLTLQDRASMAQEAVDLSKTFKKLSDL